MLEKVMELHFLLYAMMLMGGLGALGDADHTSYLPKNDQKKIQRLNQISKRNGQIFGKQETGC